jgi:hypothetical protein
MGNPHAGFSADQNDPLPSLDRDEDRADPGAETEPNRPTAPDPSAELSPGDPTEPVGSDNIRHGRVGGVMGGPRQQQGQGQGG